MEFAEDAAPTTRLALPSRLLNLAAISANRITDLALKDTGSRRYHYTLLSTLDENGPSSQADLGRCTRIDRSEVTETINDLAERRFVTRTPDPADRRRNIVSITAAGRKHLATLRKLLTDAQAQLLAALSPDERTTLVTLLTRVIGTAAVRD
ncbi:MarR family winged helix-turn-helix transcriptional regulator [Fodinicola feengrottensis]|uniref:HTH marR-type domain-containing protein n=1 Tax=Fodinicola feengrottensis TaxID=435914 RepID=A0ABN2IZH9_9ACTN|nr:MarR family transcriptional regulator [Fodinicola feengrottensis]